MKAFLDSNIFLNILLAESECHDCLKVIDGWRRCKDIDSVVTSYLSLANIAYVLRKRAGKDKVAPTIQHLMNYVSCITDSRGAEYEYACALRGPDFEDLLQYVNASLNECDILITCNKKDFQKISDPDSVLSPSGPAIITPGEFLRRFMV